MPKLAETRGSERGGEWLDRNPDAAFFTVAAHDLNGVLRGKRLRREMIGAALDGQIKLPLALLGVDMWGRDVIGSGQVFETGDQDGYCVPTGRGMVPAGLASSDALLLASLSTADGAPYAADPRNALATLVAKFRELDLTPVCATELEFYLIDPAAERSSAAPASTSGGRGGTSAIYAVSELECFRPFLDDVYHACEAVSIPAETALAESGTSQFEINLRHGDALAAADDAVLFKQIVKTAAAAHGLAATFMAKPFGEDSGSGLHIHFSLEDSSGTNLFDDGGPRGTDAMRACVAGMLRHMPESTLIFAPHYNSYRRLRRDTHAPVNIAWAYENRTASLRIPDGPAKARRIEHRVAGADANPYLVIAAVLGAALRGMDDELAPPEPIGGSAYEQTMPQIPGSWAEAIQAFGASSFAGDLFGPLLPRMFLACKKQEFDAFADVVSPLEYDLYCDRV